MIGQERLQNIFSNFTMSNLPHAVMLVGERGCGKHTLVGMLSDRLGVSVENISSKLTYDQIAEMSVEALPHFYIVDGQVSDSSQNSLLKFIEEPPSYSYVFILADNRESYLPTITGRCRVYTFDNYTDEELLNFTEDLSVIKMLRTPGKIIELSSSDSKSILDLNRTILTKISVASIPNTLSLLDKFNYGKEDGKLSIDLELPLIRSCCMDLYSETDSVVYLSAYKLLEEHSRKFLVPNVDKRKLFALLLLDLKSCLKTQ